MFPNCTYKMCIQNIYNKFTHVINVLIAKRKSFPSNIELFIGTVNIQKVAVSLFDIATIKTRQHCVVPSIDVYKMLCSMFFFHKHYRNNF